MEVVSVLALSDELCKIAFDLAEARNMLRAAKGVAVKAGGRVGLGYGAIPSQKFMGGEQRRLISEMTSRGVPQATASTALGNMKRQALQAMEGMIDNPEAWSRRKNFMVTPEKGDFVNWARKAGLPGVEHVKTPEQHMMGEALMKGHELAELAAEKRPMQAFRGVGHLSPEVILKEHNMLVTSPKSVREGLTPMMQQLRGPTGQGEAVALAPYGVQYGQGPRVSRHARRRIAETMERDIQPGLRQGYDQLAELAPELAKGTT